jgi:hypothetical protein
MLKEFAVDPRVIASSFETCRYLFSQFGADKGRLISRFPKTWKRMAIDAAADLPDGFNKERVIDYLSSINNDWLTLVGSGRSYENFNVDWLDNAMLAHKAQPFQAIVCELNDSQNHLIDANSCDENHPLFAVSKTCAVNRKADELAKIATLMLQSCRKLRLVDPYFNPARPKWRGSLAAILSLIPDISLVECEYHLLESDKSPSTDKFIEDLQKLNGVIPARGELRIIRWKEKAGGERFHRRYLLTENAGLNYEGGLDPEFNANQTTDVSLMDRDHHHARWAEYDHISAVYELVLPVLIIDSNGKVSKANI